MSEQNKAIVRRCTEEVWFKGDLEVLDELVASDYMARDGAPGQPPGRQGLKQVVAMFRDAFPDVQGSIEDIVAEGDKVVSRWTAKGTHRREYMGVAPTNKQISMTGISISRIADGKIVEDWTQEDALGVLEQLGVVQLPAQS